MAACPAHDAAHACRRTMMLCRPATMPACAAVLYIPANGIPQTGCLLPLLLYALFCAAKVRKKWKKPKRLA